MTHVRRMSLLLVGALLVAGGAPGQALAQSSPAPCAPPAVADPPLVAVPGGDAANGAPQPGPMPAVAPGMCWTGAIGNTLNGSAIAATGDTVLAPADTGALLAFGPDGTQRWSYQAGDSALAVRSVAVDATTAFVATPSGITSLSVTDGAEGWLFQVPDNESAMVLDAVGSFAAVLVGDTLLTTTAVMAEDFTITRHLVALDAATGAVDWSVVLPADGQLGRPASNGTMAVIAAGFAVQAYDLASGSTLWTAEYETIGGTVATDVAIANDQVLAGLADASVVALAVTDGSLTWRTTPPELAAAPLGLAANGDVAYLNTGLQLIAIDVATGATPWGVTLQQSAAMFSFRATPAIVQGGIVVGTTDAMDLATLVAISDAGTELWRAPTELYGALQSPVVLGGRVYTAAFGLSDGGLLAFGTP